jgi:shikimate dehydrogenase
LLSFPVTACVFGNPIEQSKSPIIHEMFAAEFGLPLVYTKRFAPKDGFEHSATQFFSSKNSIGANVTMPFKHDALKWVDSLSSQAKRAGAVNTIIRDGDRFIGDNTDGYGLVADLQNHKVSLANANILIIGAGGAAQGALPALLDAGIKSVTIYNRSLNKAEELVNYTNRYAEQKASLYRLSAATFDIIINATSLSLNANLPDLPDTIFANNPAVYDMVYLPQSTVFMQRAQQLGCTNVIDGLGMLVHQAARSFYLWFTETPNCEPVYQYLRDLNKI